MNINHMQRWHPERNSNKFLKYVWPEKSGVSGSIHQGGKYLDLLNHREHIRTLDFMSIPPIM